MESLCRQIDFIHSRQRPQFHELAVLFRPLAHSVASGRVPQRGRHVYISKRISTEDFPTIDANRYQSIPYVSDDVYFKPVCEGFYLSSIQIWEKSRMSRPPSSEALVDEVQQEDAPSTYSNRIIKPLTIVTTSIMNYISSVHGQHKTKQLITNNK
jgi:hypothetical protein